MSSEIRVRFAPSPTGALHIGGVRTALFNYLFAKKNDGKFFLRIEDTDLSRTQEGAEEHIKNSLEWLGLSWEKQVIRQSDQRDLYLHHAKQLIDQKKAYYAFDTPEDLSRLRDELQEQKSAHQHYNALVRVRMRNSLTLPEEEVKDLLEKGVPRVIRFKIDPRHSYAFDDLLRKKIKGHGSALEDKILIKSDGMPTYHFAHVVDDHKLGISHVIRGEEWLPSTPLHGLIYKALEWDLPSWVHLPLILDPHGRGKLSKRNLNANDELPLYLQEWQGIKGFKELGFLPEAVINFLGSLGYRPGPSEEEFFSLTDLEKAFSLSGLAKTSVKYDFAKALWFNEHYIQSCSPDKLLALLQVLIRSRPSKDKVLDPKLQKLLQDENKTRKICELMQKRVHRLPLILENFPLLRTLSEEEKTKYTADIKSLLHNQIPPTWKKQEKAKRMRELRRVLTGQEQGPDLKGLLQCWGESQIFTS
ncbi:MAG: glutamate--tRNA ligase [Cytophagales bacterium]|nr:glutamate--tRNA ligase [Cytophagales bacterium]